MKSMFILIAVNKQTNKKYIVYSRNVQHKMHKTEKLSIAEYLHLQFKFNYIYSTLFVIYICDVQLFHTKKVNGIQNYFDPL